ncbi:bifunctional 4-hydroxy-2-oxoglutarate aldolase/2-dehydro-3-deoxy-phosphogluconate aldolase [Pseudomonas schmalbachii]|uniref:2-dehydro-3-deoxy-phosphogluconate aldolase n=1 Tax=Pseudomonas schmalbachii TaxID=2816993 RepID=A0ABS3TPW1_9PSED|nr:bifunctional 4-hydroxy-2-oxoglutarate aldolase/2-dehydro-3-deoxy-phosphogluconate aldolase [Pseudomonas schmalbachii]MBO3275694.1 bifunctional 4-hydroxy-2-oxoglutarate aldolase/2-dehydro-3-deoxy-phosphogluconate aldolase [Pseudomonas schmalbachii]
MISLEQKTQRIDDICRRARILPVITIEREADILPMADALAAGGLDTLEITLRTSLGLTAIRILAEQRPQLIVGAGTVVDPNTFRQAEEAGAQFVVTPGCTEELLKYALESEVPLLPGVATASEIMLGYRLRYRRFKLFPAKVCGGPEALKAFAGPFPDVRFCPTGGVGPDNLNDYYRLPNVMCVGGSWMLPKALIDAGDWAAIERLSREAVELLASK